MRSSIIALRAAALLLTVSSAFAADCSAVDLKQTTIKLMQETKVAAVTEIKVPADKYVSDGDPDTLEIVFLSKPEDGPSHVSDDGEVIFLNNATDDEQSALIGKAFEIRAKRQLSCK